MVNDLITLYNIVPKKTFNIDFKFPFNTIPKKYLINFIIGVLDGDGCIFYSRKLKRVSRISIVGTQKDFLESCIGILNLTNNCTKYNYQVLNKKTNLITYTRGITVKKKDQSNLFKLLYNNSIYHLDRKKAKFIVNTEENLETKKSKSP